MSERIASAVFDNREEAERAMSELRSAGIPQEAISVIGRREDGSIGDDDGDDGVNKSGAVKGALGGAAAGTLLGLAALAIPGVGPLAAAGAIAAAAAPEAAAIGAGIGATAGGLTGLFSTHGVSDEDASYYESRVNEGGIFLAVHADRSDISLETAREILFSNGGHSASRERMASTQ